MGHIDDWEKIEGLDPLDSPALLIDADKVASNIKLMIEMVGGDVHRLRPHVKTYKMAEVVQMQMKAGMTKFKCATIAEAEMLALCQAPDVLLAHQPTFPKALRLLELVRKYPKTVFSCIVDNMQTLAMLEQLWYAEPSNLHVYIDIDNGNNRTGVIAEMAEVLANKIMSSGALILQGLHVYDGHIRISEFDKRKEMCDQHMLPVVDLRKKLERSMRSSLQLIAGGSPSFTVHAHYPDRICSPGTCIFWDYGYSQKLPDMNFEMAARVFTRIVSLPGDDLICLDLGHKAIAAENPIGNRVYFPALATAEPVLQSEEHLVIRIAGGHNFKVGDSFVGIPYHICPTVALYEEANVIDQGTIMGNWTVIARKRRINI